MISRGALCARILNALQSTPYAALNFLDGTELEKPLALKNALG